LNFHKPLEEKEMTLDDDYKKEVKEKLESLSCRLRKKVPWIGAGVIVACITVVAFLAYNAYSGEQIRQNEGIAENSVQVQELKTNVKVMEVEFSHVRDKLQDLKNAQETQFREVIKRLDKLNEKGDTRR